MTPSTSLPVGVPPSDNKGGLKVIEMKDFEQSANNDDTIGASDGNISKHAASVQESQDDWAAEPESTSSRSKLRLATVMLALYVSLAL